MPLQNSSLQKKRTPTPSTLEETQKLLASSEDCKKEQDFKQHRIPDTKSWLFDSISDIQSSRWLQMIPHNNFHLVIVLC